jgi:hypothetical protein
MKKGSDFAILRVNVAYKNRIYREYLLIILTKPKDNVSY